VVEGAGGGQANRRAAGTGLWSREGDAEARRAKAARWRLRTLVRGGSLAAGERHLKALTASAGGAGRRGDEVVAAGLLETDVEQWSPCRTLVEPVAG
jgi:hypothetical protein